MADLITGQEVADHMQLATDPAPMQTEMIAAEVTGQVTEWHGEAWPPGVKLGALMLAARLHRRRNSSTGVESVSEVGATYVSRYDNDLDRQLRIGAWLPPRVG